MASPWIGAPPVTAEGFAYAEGEFFAQASGQNRHRRATLAELQTHFSSGSDRAFAAHWFEAQLLHYGLPVSKSKSVARMRLYDAWNGGKLAVPGHIARLEGDLKKEWTKRNREAKKAVGVKREIMDESVEAVPAAKKAKTGPSAAKMAATPKPTPNKAEPKASKAAMPKPAPKKAEPKTSNKTTAKPTPPKKAEPKTSNKTTAKPTPPNKAEPKTSNKTTAKQTPPKKTTAKPTPPKKSEPKPKTSASKPRSDETPKPAKKQTARRGGISAGPSHRAPQKSPTPERRPRLKQTARRSGGWAGRGRIDAPAPPQVEESPMARQTAPRGSGLAGPPRQSYSTSGTFGYGSYDSDDARGQSLPARSPSSCSGCYSYDSDDAPPPYSTQDPNNDANLGPLGFINGVYYVSCDSNWGHSSECNLSLAICGTQLWARFDFAILYGIMRFEERPWRSSHRQVPFSWRGGQVDGPISDDDDSNQGAIKFLGDGRIQGHIDFMGMTFEGYRSDEGFGSVSARAYQDEWGNYNEECKDTWH
ncbi:hypothetical protein CDD81_6806 [Ophiocordyceps australis]|uniref:Uncharacterized protein n=1 Tax=Ophiocordyceps australis TaxID=1399860 RepID=A0A2C5Y5E8_9HYPO|nr:hypothetical protein CDD81_6806 [Ophiocordyceps australis]